MPLAPTELRKKENFLLTTGLSCVNLEDALLSRSVFYFVCPKIDSDTLDKVAYLQ